MTLEGLDAFVRSAMDDYKTQLVDLVRIPSISQSATHASELDRVADAMASLLRSYGVSADVYRRGSFPAVVGTLEVDPSAPWVMVYNHLDVQPAGEKEWVQTNPFEPIVTDEQIIGRGTTDDKGPALTIVHAIRYLHETGQLPVNVQFLYETEEESGSRSFDAFLKEYGSALQTPDSILVSDTIFEGDTPTITYKLRGLTMMVVRLETGTAGVHSGIAGGFARNPLTTLTTALGRCVDPDTGKVLVPGFYDGTEHPNDTDDTEMAIIRSVASNVDLTRFREEMGFHDSYRANSLEAILRMQHMPTLEVHGFRPEAAGTKIHPYAEAEISMRLVAGQDPYVLRDRLEAYLREVHSGITVRCEEGIRAVHTPLDSPFMAHAAEACLYGFGKSPLYVAAGGTIGAFPPLQAQFPNAPLVLIAQSLASDHYHGPNEEFRWQQAEDGMKAIAHYVHNIGNLRTAGK